jgi:hypothetical protein
MGTGRRFSYVDLSLFQVMEGLRYAFPRTMEALAPRFRRLRAVSEGARERPRLRLVPRLGAADPVQHRRCLPALSPSSSQAASTDGDRRGGRARQTHVRSQA